MRIKTLKARPWVVMWQINRSFKWLKKSDVAGISYIELRDDFSPAVESSAEWHKVATQENWSVNAQYFPETLTQPAFITLYLRPLFRAIPRAYWPTPVTTLNVIRTLSHEIGHHLVAKRGYVFDQTEDISSFEQEEELANRYSALTVANLKGWRWRFALWLNRDLADSYYQQGIIRWQANNYTQAAESWYRAFLLEPDHEHALYWYHRAKERCSILGGI
jgi:hypothetical protein